MKSLRRNSGQSLVEYSVLVATAIVAVVMATHYVRMAFVVHSIDVEEELSGRPIP